MIPVLPLPVDLVNATLDVSEPTTEDLVFVRDIRTLAQVFLSIVVIRMIRSAFADSLLTCFPLSHELRVTHTQQLCAARSVRRRHSHQLANGKLVAFPQHKGHFSRAPFVRVETILNPSEQVYQALGIAALLRGKTHELSLRSQDVRPAEILAEQEGGVDYQAVLIIRRAVQECEDIVLGYVEYS